MANCKKFKKIDIVKPCTCENWREHRQLRKVASLLKSNAWQLGDSLFLLVSDNDDPCKWIIIRQKLPNNKDFFAKNS